MARTLRSDDHREDSHPAHHSVHAAHGGRQPRGPAGNPGPGGADRPLRQGLQRRTVAATRSPPASLPIVARAPRNAVLGTVAGRATRGGSPDLHRMQPRAPGRDLRPGGPDAHGRPGRPPTGRAGPAPALPDLPSVLPHPSTSFYTAATAMRHRRPHFVVLQARSTIHRTFPVASTFRPGNRGAGGRRARRRNTTCREG